MVKTEDKVEAVMLNLNTIYRPGTGERAQMRIWTEQLAISAMQDTGNSSQNRGSWRKAKGELTAGGVGGKEGAWKGDNGAKWGSNTE